MTVLNASIAGNTVNTFSGFSSGVCDASNGQINLGAGHPVVTLEPLTDGVSPPSSNVTRVYGSFGGMKMTVAPDAPGNTPQTDGSHATIQYADVYDNNGNGVTGGADISVSSNVTFLATLFGASSYPGVNISSLTGGPAASDTGQRVAAATGDAIRFEAGYTGASVSIVVGISALTLIDRMPFNATGTAVLVVNLNWRETTYSILDAQVPAANGTTIPAVVINSASNGANAGGVILTNLGMNAAALTARMTVQSFGGYPQSLTFK